MAEFCKKCFIDNILISSERAEYENGKLKIIMFEEDDFCEGCGKIAPVVNHIIKES